MSFSPLFWQFLICACLLLPPLISLCSDVANLKAAKRPIPSGFSDLYDGERYAQSQEYLRARTHLSMLEHSLVAVVSLGFILLGGMRWLDDLIAGAVDGVIFRGTFFLLALVLAMQVLSLPFSLYSTFIIEERFGFNRSSLGVWLSDLVKGLLLGLFIGVPVLATIIWFFQATGSSAWLFCWMFISIVQLVLMVIAPVVLMPLFNKFTELEAGDVREGIMQYAQVHGFPLRGVFRMDGSKRSAKGNAFFTGFGRARRVVLFDTLIEKHPKEELLAIFAHEVGHYKHRHILKGLVVAIVMTGVSCFFLSLILNHEGLLQALNLESPNIHGSLVAFSLIYAPIGICSGLLTNWRSRKHEYEADRFAAKTTSAAAMIAALKRLSADTLSNLTPHGLKIAISYSHPTVVQRAAALEALGKREPIC